MKALGRGSVASLIEAVLGFGRIGLAVALLVAVGVTLAVPFMKDPRMTVSVPVSFSMDAPASVSVGRTEFGFEIPDEQEVEQRKAKGRIDRVEGALRVPTSSRLFIVANALVLIVIIAFALYVVGQLRDVFRTLSAGRPFVPENAVRIQRVAYAVIGGELVRSMIVFAENYYAMTHVTIAGLQFDAWPRVNMMPIGNGLIILVIAEVFRIGTRLDEDQSLTI